MSYVVESGSSRARRTRRRRALITLGIVALMLFFAFWYAYSYYQDSNKAKASPTPSCTATTTATGKATGKATPAARTPAQVTVNIYNATERTGLAAKTAADVRKRGYKVSTVSNDPLQRNVTIAAEVRYGTSGTASAKLVLTLVKGAEGREGQPRRLVRRPRPGREVHRADRRTQDHSGQHAALLSPVSGAEDPPAAASSIATTPVWPKCPAHTAGVAPNRASVTAGSAPSSRSSETVAVSPFPAAACRPVSQGSSEGTSVRARRSMSQPRLTARRTASWLPWCAAHATSPGRAADRGLDVGRVGVVTGQHCGDHALLGGQLTPDAEPGQQLRRRDLSCRERCGVSRSGPHAIHRDRRGGVHTVLDEEADPRVHAVHDGPPELPAEHLGGRHRGPAEPPPPGAAVARPETELEEQLEVAVVGAELPVVERLRVVRVGALPRAGPGPGRARAGAPAGLPHHSRSSRSGR